MKVLLSENQIAAGIQTMARAVATDWDDRPMTIVGILTGSLVLVADLIRQLPMPLRVDFIQASSYRGGTQPQELRLNPELQPDIAGRDVLLVDDIFDTGHTLVRVREDLQRHRPRSLQTAVLLRKSARCEVDYQPDYVGFDIPDQFVVGYGLDYRDEYRNLPYVAALEAEDLRDGDA